jgi:peptidoglycan/LPS O-acetylase OafA/YrhL
VVLTHVPEAYSNFLQISASGFSQVSVTLFFLFSAYGLLISIMNKPGYLKHFWKNRVLVLCAPFLVSAIIKLLLGGHPGDGGTFFVLVLLLFYVITYFAAKYFSKWTLWIVCGSAVAYSLIGSITGLLKWPTQVLGFAYGAILAYGLPRVKALFTQKYWLKIVATSVFACLLTVVYVLGKQNIPGVLRIIFQNLMVAFIILWVFLVTFRLQIGNSISRYLGRISYDVFLYHGIVERWLPALAKTPLKAVLNSDVFILLMVAFSIAIASITYYFNEKLIAFIRKK